MSYPSSSAGEPANSSPSSGAASSSWPTSQPNPPFAGAGFSGFPPGSYPLADWGQRALARLIDFAILLIPAGGLALLLGVMAVGSRALNGEIAAAEASRTFAIIAAVVWFLVWAGYDSVCIARWGRTLGKSAMRLTVVPLSDPSGHTSVPLGRVLVRAAVFNVLNLFNWLSSGLVMLVFMLNVVFLWLWPLWDKPNRQGMHDKVAGTVVVQGP
ncbi:RDD family protein [Salinactinospora qingdaonensis]|uniref:RDD domain-containing protein n=1 Tax=Salinactinospora qingdaonensis TaxID=702744 RepID=A0ABP7EXP5_9ACTN